MFSRARLLSAIAVAAPSLGAPSVMMAETPADTFIQARTPNDMFSVDPAEVFEFSA